MTGWELLGLAGLLSGALSVGVVVVWVSAWAVDEARFRRKSRRLRAIAAREREAAARLDAAARGRVSVLAEARERRATGSRQRRPVRRRAAQLTSWE